MVVVAGGFGDGVYRSNGPNGGLPATGILGFLTVVAGVIVGFKTVAGGGVHGLLGPHGGLVPRVVSGLETVTGGGVYCLLGPNGGLVST